MLCSWLAPMRRYCLAFLMGPVYGLGLFIGAWPFGVADEAVLRRICTAVIVVAVLDEW